MCRLTIQQVDQQADEQCDGGNDDVVDRWFLEHKKLLPWHHII
jgi:hypothetical protein